jgi:hypothetical protein
MILQERRWHPMSAKDDCLCSWKLRYLSIPKPGFNLSGAVAAVVPFVVLGEEDESSMESLETEYEDNSRVPQLSVLQIFWFFFSQFGIFAWGGPRSPNRTHQRTPGGQRSMDNYGPFHSRFWCVPNTPWAGSR